jgi:hypothetical protein
MDELTKIKIEELVYKSLEGIISKEEYAELESLIQLDSQALKYYTSSIDFNLGMQKLGVCMTTPLQMEMALQGLAEYEKVAPEAEIIDEQPRRELIHKVVYPSREKRKMSKFSKVFLVINAAAVLFFILFLRFAPPKGGIEVATLIDSLNAKWADANISMQKGVRLYTNKTPLLLKEGLVEIKFDNNARVTVEGPAEFQILDIDMIKLNYGRLYSRVPSEAFGFQVSTKHARITDLGTEFGVKEEIGGDIEVHVLEGQVNLVSGILNKKINIDLLDGSARKLNTETGDLIEIPCSHNLFARQIDSTMNIVWRGQEILDLADIVGGGNGLGTGLLGSGIDAATGTYVTTPTRVEFPRIQCQYNPVQSNPFIDGVFVPDGSEETVILNSNGDSYAGFPVTEGIYRSPITHGPAIRDRQRFPSRYFKESTEFYLLELGMGGVLYGTPDNPAVYMHSNVGITFDLDAIRSVYGKHTIAYFESTCGIPETVRREYASKIKNPETGMLALYVFLDGQRQLIKTFDHDSQPEKIRIPIKLESRFLTIAVVDTGLNSDYDWCLLGNPVLKFE